MRICRDKTEASVFHGRFAVSMAWKPSNLCSFFTLQNTHRPFSITKVIHALAWAYFNISACYRSPDSCSPDSCESTFQAAPSQWTNLHQWPAFAISFSLLPYSTGQCSGFQPDSLIPAPGAKTFGAKSQHSIFNFLMIRNRLFHTILNRNHYSTHNLYFPYSRHIFICF